MTAISSKASDFRIKNGIFGYIEILLSTIIMLMSSLTSYLDIAILLGALQGFIFSGLLFSSAKDRQANRLLAWVLILVAVASLKLFGTQKGWLDLDLVRLVDTFIPLVIVMPVGPLIFFYVRSSLHPDFRLSRKDRIHFYPVVIDCVPQLTALIFVLGLATHTIANKPAPWGRFIDDYNVYSDLPRWISVTFYIWLAAKEISASKGLQEKTAGSPNNRFKWLQQLIRIFQVFQGIWLLYLIPYLIPKYTDLLLTRLGWYPVYVPLAVLIYWLGIKGYIVSQTASGLAKSRESQQALPRALVETTIETLRMAMEKDKLYLNPSLTVALLAGHTGIVQKNISAVLNQHLHKSFNEFVNEYRVHAIKDRFLKDETRNLTIAGMAYDGGFNSLPTFQRAFKAIIGQTPKEFLANKLNERQKTG